MDCLVSLFLQIIMVFLWRNVWTLMDKNLLVDAEWISAEVSLVRHTTRFKLLFFGKINNGIFFFQFSRQLAWFYHWFVFRRNSLSVVYVGSLTIIEFIFMMLLWQFVWLQRFVSGVDHGICLKFCWVKAILDSRCRRLATEKTY